MTQEVIIDPTHIRAVLFGSVHVKDARSIKEKLTTHIANGKCKIVIDLTAVDYIDGYGLGTLVSIHKSARKKGGGVELIGLKGYVLSLFESTQLEKAFKVS